MNTWTDKKISNGKFSTKSEKSLAYTHETDNFASTILKFTWLDIDGFMEEIGLAPLPNMILVPHNTQGQQEIWNFPSS